MSHMLRTDILHHYIFIPDSNLSIDITNIYGRAFEGQLVLNFNIIIIAQRG